MRKPVMILGCLFAAQALAAATFPAATPDDTAAHIQLTARQAREALQVLDDPSRRAQLEDTLRAIAAAAAPAPTSSPGAAPSSITALAPAAIRPNGLISQLVRQGTTWGAQSGLSLRRSLAALLDTSSFKQWWQDLLHDPLQRSATAGVVWTLCGAMLPALALAWLAQRLVRQRRRAPIAASSVPHYSAAPGIILHRVPRAALKLVLNLLTLAVFAVTAIVLMSLLAETGHTPDRSLDGLIDIGVSSRGLVLIGAFLLQPDDASLRLLPISDQWAAFAQRWLNVITGVIAAGLILAETALALGLRTDAYLALMKVIALVGHVLISIVILQCRKPVAARIRARWPPGHALGTLGSVLADCWSFLAVFIVMALWFVWALDVRNGYRVLVQLGGSTIAVLVLARLVSIVVFGALARVFHAQDARTGDSLLRQHAYRYYPWLHRLLSWTIALLTGLLLLRLWGANVGQWFQHGSIAHRLGSTLLTIAIAVAIALFAWELVNVAVERRLDRWTRANELARAARLRTLVPMLRGVLLLALVPIVLLTALSDLGVNVAPLVAGASIFGVALGFGSQKLVQDFITGIFLLLDDAMQVGDWVTVAGVSGTVEHLSIRTVRLRGADGSLYTVPFSSVSTVNNTNRGLGNAAVTVHVAYGQDIDLAIATLKEIGAALRADPQFKDGILSDFDFWGVDQLDGAAVTLSGQLQCLDSARWGVQREFNRRILDLFRARGIEIANPLRSVVLPGNAVPENTESVANAAGAVTQRAAGKAVVL